MIFKAFIISSFSLLLGQSNELTVQVIITAMDDNLNAKSRVMTSKMIVHGRRSCLLYTSPSPRDLSTSRMPSSA